MLKKEGNQDTKIAIVTGGSKGIGKGIADMLAKQGIKVIIADISEEKTSHEFIKCDVSKEEDCNRLIDQVIKNHKKVDILINNAGIYPFVPFENMTSGQWDNVISVDLRSMFLCTKAALPHMNKQKFGRIINISSIAAWTAFIGLAHYSAAKAGIIGLTRQLAVELAPHNITVNAIAPGAIATPGTKNSLTGNALTEFLKKIPAGRIGKPEDIAHAAIFLASEQASYITGQTLTVDGGFTLI